MALSVAPLNPAQLERDPASVTDPAAYVFRFEGRVYRAILPEGTFVLEVVEHPLFREMVERGWMADARPAELAVEGAVACLELEPVVPVSYLYEWCGAAIKDALLHGCRLCRFLLERQAPFVLLDPHLNNITLRRGRPVYLDHGSLVKYRPGAPAFSVFELVRMVKVALIDGDPTGEQFGLEGLTVRHAVTDAEQFVATIDAIERLSKQEVTPDLFARFEAALDSLEVHENGNEWTGYSDPIPETADFAVWVKTQTRKESVIYETLRRLRPASVFDFGMNEGVHAFMADSLGVRVVGVDNCGTTVAAALREVRRRDADVLPLEVSLMNMPGAGWPIRLPEHRLGCEAGIAAAITHHFARQGHTFEAMADLFNRYCRKWVLVQFIPREDEHVFVRGGGRGQPSGKASI